MRALVDRVQHNERTLRRFQRMELQLIGAQDFASFLATLFVDLPKEFSLDAVVVWVDERAPLMADMVGAEALEALGQPALKTAQTTGFALARLCPAASPWLGALEEVDAKTRANLFGEGSPCVCTIVLPLKLNGRTNGYLCLGSATAGRFGPGMATDILERFASIVAASLDNVAHRERLKLYGMTDALTGLANRRHFDERLREELMRAARYALPVGCLFIDIDRFKQINDTHGHATGDRVLATVAACLRQQLRIGDTLARHGGEEFAALLQGDREEILIAAERVRRAVASLEVHDERGARIAVTVSIGATSHTVPGPQEAARVGAALLEEADHALYRAKHNGRNRVESYTHPTIQ
nr:diguanylate cyclase [Paraburkholderia phosphatilytica]